MKKTKCTALSFMPKAIESALLHAVVFDAEEHAAQQIERLMESPFYKGTAYKFRSPLAELRDYFSDFVTFEPVPEFKCPLKQPKPTPVNPLITKRSSKERERNGTLLTGNVQIVVEESAQPVKEPPCPISVTYVGTTTKPLQVRDPQSFMLPGPRTRSGKSSGNKANGTNYRG